MYHYQVGRGPDGRSIVARGREVSPAFEEGATVAIDRIGYWPRAELEGGIVGEVKDSEFLRIAIDEGDMRWTFMRMAPGHTSHVHHTDTWDFNIVLEGDTKVLLGDGEVHLHRGDTILMTGLEHQWVSGPHGCLVASVLRGMRRRT